MQKTLQIKSVARRDGYLRRIRNGDSTTDLPLLVGILFSLQEKIQAEGCAICGHALDPTDRHGIGRRCVEELERPLPWSGPTGLASDNDKPKFTQEYKP